MYAPQTTVIAFALFSILIYLFGFWLSRSGRPHSTLLLTAHKLIALAALIVLATTLNRLHQSATLGPFEIAAATLTGLFFIIAGISGGLVSAANQMPAAIVLLHKISPHLTTLSTAATLYLLLTRQ